MIYSLAELPTLVTIPVNTGQIDVSLYGVEVAFVPPPPVGSLDDAVWNPVSWNPNPPVGLAYQVMFYLGAPPFEVGPGTYSVGVRIDVQPVPFVGFAGGVIQIQA